MGRALGTLPDGQVALRAPREGSIPVGPAGQQSAVAGEAVRRKIAASRDALVAPRETLSATIERRRARPRTILFARSGVAAALAYLAALHLHLAPMPVLAPLTAVLVVQATI